MHGDIPRDVVLKVESFQDGARQGLVSRLAKGPGINLFGFSEDRIVEMQRVLSIRFALV